MQKIYNLAEIQAICRDLPADDYKQAGGNRLGLNRNGGYGLVAFNKDKSLVEDFPRGIRIENKTEGEWTAALKTAGTSLPAAGPKQNLKMLQLVIACVLFPDMKLNPNTAQQQEVLRYLYPLLQAYNQTVADSVFIAIQKAVQAFNELFYDAKTRAYSLQYYCDIDLNNTVRNLYYRHDQNEWVMHEKGIILFRDPKDNATILPGKIRFEAFATFSCFPSDSGSIPAEHSDGFKLQYMQATDMFYYSTHPSEKDEITDDNTVGFAGLLEPFLHWNKKTHPPFHTYLAATLNAKMILSPDLMDFLLAPLEVHKSQLPAWDVVQKSAAGKLQSHIKDKKGPEFTFIEVCDLNSPPLCQFFDVLTPLIVPDLAKKTTFPRKMLPRPVPPLIGRIHPALTGVPTQIAPTDHFQFENPIAHINPMVVDLAAPGLTSDHTFNKADLDSFRNRVIIDNIHGYGLSNHGGFGTKDAYSELINDLKRGVRLHGKPLFDWNKDQSLEKKINISEDASPEETFKALANPDQLRELIIEIIQKKVLKNKKPLPSDPDFAARIHFAALTKVYDQTIHSFPYNLISRMIRDEIDLPWGCAQTRKVFDLYYDHKATKWMIKSSVVVTICYPQAPDAVNRRFIANIRYDLLSSFKIPPIPDYVYHDSRYNDLRFVTQLIATGYQKGFKPVELKFEGHTDIINCLIAYFYKEQNPNSINVQNFLTHAMHIVRFYKPFGCIL